MEKPLFDSQFRNKTGTRVRKLKKSRKYRRIFNCIFLLQTLFHKINVVLHWKKITIHTLYVCVRVIMSGRKMEEGEERFAERNHSSVCLTNQRDRGGIVRDPGSQRLDTIWHSGQKTKVKKSMFEVTQGFSLSVQFWKIENRVRNVFNFQIYSCTGLSRGRFHRRGGGCLGNARFPFGFHKSRLWDLVQTAYERLLIDT